MKTLLSFVGLMCSYELLASRSIAAELSGRIVVTKPITKKQVTMPVYQLRGVASPPPPKSASPASEQQKIVVFLEGDSSSADAPVRTELLQQNGRFEPQILIIPVGSTVSFPNADPIFHNVFSLSKAKRFDLGYYPAGQTRVVKFDEAGVVQVYCHLHPNMYAAIVVVPNHWHTQPADDGTFSITGVPPGKYHLVAWHMSAGFFRKMVRVLDGSNTNVVVNIPVHDDESVQ